MERWERNGCVWAYRFPNEAAQWTTSTAKYIERNEALSLIDDLLAREQLSHYHLTHSARADLCRRLGRIPEARASMKSRSHRRGRNRSAVFLARRREIEMKK